MSLRSKYRVWRARRTLAVARAQADNAQARVRVAWADLVGSPDQATIQSDPPHETI